MYMYAMDQVVAAAFHGYVNLIFITDFPRYWNLSEKLNCSTDVKINGAQNPSSLQTFS